MLLLLVLAAVLEVGGDAAIRQGLLRTSGPWMVLGALGLTAYGFTVNTDRAINFGRLMGLYIVVFFVVSQVVSFAISGERPTTSLLVGGALIVSGGLVIQLGTH
jgi:drug/metabolite transporter superfamily protein YnfA